MTPHSDPTRDFFEACSRTELYQLCMRVGLVVSPAMPREKLVSFLIGDEVPPSLEHPVHVWRNGLIGLIEDYWTGIEAQLRCPAKELGPPAKEGEPPKPDPSDPKAPLACYRCVDTRVLACVVENAKHESLIQLHRKMTVSPKKDANDMTMTIGTLTLETAPRTMEGMGMGDGVGRGLLKRLYDALVNDGAAPGDEKAMVAFVDATTETRRQLVVQYLQVWDQMKGRAGSQGAVVPAGSAPNAPTPTPVVSGAAEPRRTPSNRGKRVDAAPEDGAPNPGPALNVGDAIVQHLEALREGLVGIKTMLEGNGAQGLKLDQNAGVRHAEVLGALQSLEKSVKMSAAITLWQIENQGDTAPSEVLTQAGTYITILDRFIAGGKAS